MKIGVALLTALALAPAPAGLARTEPFQFPELRARGLSCGDFHHNRLGSWTPTRRVTVLGPSGRFTVQPHEEFSLDSTFMSVNIAAILDERCL